MKPAFSLAIAALLAISLAGPASAKTKHGPIKWPFGQKVPPNPALGMLDKIDDVSVDISKTDPQLITITVKAMAPRPGYSDLTLVDKPGPLDDMTFAFEARGRPPQDMTQKPQATEVTLTGTYKDAPIAKVQSIEIYANQNCVAYSVADHTTGNCKVKMPPAEPSDED